MQQNMITEDNWNYCHYVSGNLKAIIGLGSSPDAPDDGLIYYVTVLDEHNNELLQEEFSVSSDACHFINNKYSTLWEFNNMTQDTNSSDSGCSTCIAH
jgi:hypothetical protein